MSRKSRVRVPYGKYHFDVILEWNLKYSLLISIMSQTLVCMFASRNFFLMSFRTFCKSTILSQSFLPFSFLLPNILRSPPSQVYLEWGVTMITCWYGCVLELLISLFDVLNGSLVGLYMRQHKIDNNIKIPKHKIKISTILIISF